MTMPVPASAFDATSDQQLFAACSTLYVQPRAGCVRPLAVAEGTVRRVAIVGDSYAVVQAGGIRVVDAQGIVRAAWHSPRWGIWNSRLPPVVVSGSVIDFFADDELLELNPQTGVTRRLALNPGEPPANDVGDLYAVGASLYHLVAGRPPFAGGSLIEAVRMIRGGQPEPLEYAAPGCPRSLADVIERAMSKVPDLRYPDAMTMQIALSRVQREIQLASQTAQGQL